jgi:hypothetical protein
MCSLCGWLRVIQISGSEAAGSKAHSYEMQQYANTTLETYKSGTKVETLIRKKIPNAARH